LCTHTLIHFAKIVNGNFQLFFESLRPNGPAIKVAESGAGARAVHDLSVFRLVLVNAKGRGVRARHRRFGFEPGGVAQSEKFCPAPPQNKLHFVLARVSLTRILRPFNGRFRKL